MMKFKKMLFSLALEFDVAESLSVDEYYGAKGVCVRPDYRGLGIAQEFLRLRRLICKERNMPFTSAWMTAFGTQKAAARDGWKSVFELDLEKFGQQVDAVFKNTPPTFKFMIA
ncbi:hypothetical protein K1T71_008871 [Dendrolimus kikuchii]|uniref:Uncharacterized protein n=1 Tax=Dendrolimus kikuchii TaxID=765133 RepID=A0ACC1CVT6_9NEOP|nr:hypothetical protein K1T71_008871 [Dendrolimus kikuchii]